MHNRFQTGVTGCAWLVIACFFLNSTCLFGQSSLRIQIQALQSDTDLTHASWSLCVMDARKDSVLAEYNSNASLIPASTMKIVTTAAALAILGWDFKYETALEYDGTLDTVTGTLHGNLYIKGSGDPTLDSETFKKKNDTIPLTDQWAKVLSGKGIKKIEGAVVADASVFEEEMIPSTWIWGDMGNYYGAGASGLNFKDNKFTIYFRSGAQNGDSAFITRISPDIPNMRLRNFAYTRGYSDLTYIYGAPYSLTRYVKGTLPKNKVDYKVEGSMPDPALFCAQSLDSSLRRAGIIIEKRANAIRRIIPSPEEFLFTTDSAAPVAPVLLIPADKDAKPLRLPIYKQSSHTLDKIVYQTNLQSNNLFAETLLKTIAWKKTKFGDDQTAIDLVTSYWKKQGIALRGFYMADGCGLSRFNAITTRQLAGMLRVLTRDSVLFNKFYASLPIAGKSGSLGKLCKGTCAENNLRAKSGYMTRVRSYAGYVTSKKGRLLSFAVIVNNYDCTPQEMKDKLEKLMVGIAEMD